MPHMTVHISLRETMKGYQQYIAPKYVVFSVQSGIIVACGVQHDVSSIILATEILAD